MLKGRSALASERRYRRARARSHASIPGGGDGGDNCVAVETRWYSGRIAAILAAVGVASCGSPSAPSGPPRPPSIAGGRPTPTMPVSLAPLGQVGCAPASPVDKAFEVQGTIAGGLQLWGLLEPQNGLPVRSHSSVKIVWRMTGAGPLKLAAVGPASLDLLPDFGPEIHEGSSWTRPGDEWGSSFTFPTSGCWDVQLTRGAVTGHVWLVVVG